MQLIYDDTKFLQTLHVGKALVRGREGARAGPASRGIAAKIACSGCVARVEDSKTDRPSSESICRVDLVLFCFFFFSLSARKSFTSFSRILIALWFDRLWNLIYRAIKWTRRGFLNAALNRFLSKKPIFAVVRSSKAFLAPTHYPGSRGVSAYGGRY
jgi:hypothetical protein